jgi:cobalt-zinc-cadmium efflux system outer membrane protein
MAMKARSEKPIGVRCLFSASMVLVLGFVSITSRSSAQALDEHEVIRRLTTSASLDRLARSRSRAALGHARTEGAWPAIELTYTREQTFGTGATGEDYIGATLPLDLANRRGLRGEAWEQRARAAEDRVDEERRARVAAARVAFHRAIAARAAIETLDAWIVRVDGLIAAVRARAEAGDVARYDLLRLERERATAAARRGREQALLDGARAELAAWIDLEGDHELAGEILPPPPEPLTSAVDRIDALPDLRAFEEDAEAARLEAESAGRGWVPEVGLTLGAKLVDLYGNRTDGLYAGGVLRLPLFDLGIGARETAEAEAEVAREERVLARLDAEREVRGAHAEAARLADTARTFEAEATERSMELMGIVDASYAAGEATVLELLDAQRGAADDRLTAIDLGLAAWVARIELDRASGAEVIR